MILKIGLRPVSIREEAGAGLVMCLPMRRLMTKKIGKWGIRIHGLIRVSRAAVGFDRGSWPWFDLSASAICKLVT